MAYYDMPIQHPVRLEPVKGRRWQEPVCGATSFDRLTTNGSQVWPQAGYTERSADLPQATTL